MTASSSVVLSNLAYLIGAVVLAIIGGLADEWISYILPIEQYNLGKYEASMSFYGPTLADVIVKGAIAGVENLQKHTPTTGQARP